jgi:hypothetical protein
LGGGDVLGLLSGCWCAGRWCGPVCDARVWAVWEEVRVGVDVGDEGVDLRGRVGEGAAGAEGFGRGWAAVVGAAGGEVGEG